MIRKTRMHQLTPQRSGQIEKKGAFAKYKLPVLACSLLLSVAGAKGAIEVQLGAGSDGGATTFTYNNLASTPTFDGGALDDATTVGENAISGASGSFTINVKATQSSALHNPSTWTFGTADASISTLSTGWGASSTGQSGLDNMLADDEAFLLTFDLTNLTIDAGQVLVFSVLSGADSESYRIYQRTDTAVAEVVASKASSVPSTYSSAVVVDGMLEFAITDSGFDTGGINRMTGFSIDVVDKPIPNEWKVIPEDPNFPTDDVIVAYCNVTNAAHNLPEDTANTDCTSAFQDALNDARDAGGGTVFVPEGIYRIDGNLTIAPNVILRGRWKEITATQPASGTILALYNTGPDAVITLTGNGCGIRDLTFWHPEQNATTPVEYPYVFSGRHQQTTIENVTLVNAYNGIDMSSSSMCCPRGIYGTPLSVGLMADKSYAVSRYDSIHFSPDYWVWSGLPGSPSAGGAHETFIRNNGIAVDIHEMDGFYFVFSTISGYNKGISFSEGASGDDPWGSMGYVTVTDCETALHLAETKTIKFASCTFDGNQYGVYAEEDDARNIKVLMNNCTLIGGAGSASAIHFEDLSGTAQLVNCTVNGAVTALGSAHIFESSTSTPLTPFDNNYIKTRKPATTDLFNVMTYGAEGDGTTDDTVAIQNAVAAAKANGGGIVFVPDGEYVMTGNLDLGSGVELRGNSGGRHLTSTKAGYELGSLLLINHGEHQPNGTPFIKMSDYSGVRGMSFHYPKQNYTEDLSYDAYPFMIQANGIQNYIIDCAASNPYQATQLNGDDHLVEYSFFGALRSAFQANNCSNGRVQNQHVKPGFWRDMGTDGNPWEAVNMGKFKFDIGEDLQVFSINNCVDYTISSIFNHACHDLVAVSNSSGQALMVSAEQVQRGYTLLGGDRDFEFQVCGVCVNNLGDYTGQIGMKTYPGFTGTARSYAGYHWGVTDEGWAAEGGSLYLEQCEIGGFKTKGAHSIIAKAGATLTLESCSVEINLGIEDEGTVILNDCEFEQGMVNSHYLQYVNDNHYDRVSIIADLNQDPVKDYGIELDMSNLQMVSAPHEVPSATYPTEGDNRRFMTPQVVSGNSYNFDVTDADFTDGAKTNLSFDIKAMIQYHSNVTFEVWYATGPNEMKRGRIQSFDATDTVRWFNIKFTADDATLNATDGVDVRIDTSVPSASVVAELTISTDEVPTAPVVNTGPTPNPMTFEVVPTATSSSAITMTATLATDPDGDPVEYCFWNRTTGEYGWQSNRTYTATNLNPETAYNFSVRARDDQGNIALYSATFTATTQSDAPAAPTSVTSLPGIGQVELDWADNGEANLDSYNVYRSEISGSYGAPLATITSSDYIDNTAVDHTTYYYVVTAVDTSSNESVMSAECSATPGWIAEFAASDSAVLGTVSGTLANSDQNDDLYQTITEVVSGSTSALEHKWTFSVTAAELVTFYLEAHHSSNSEGDDFVFAYSTNDVNYIDMVVVTNTADNDTAQHFSMPSGLSGTVYIRATDMDRTDSNTQLDSLHIDALFIVSEESTIAPYQAQVLAPVNGATDVPLNAQLSWDAGIYTVSHKVYFGTNTSVTLQNTQSETEFDPGTLLPDTTYYWAIDEVNDSGTTAGALWSFTTIADGSGPLTPSTASFDSIVAIDSTTIRLTANPATQSTGAVLYRFWCRETGVYSPWLSEPTYDYTGLTPSTSYEFKVYMKDDDTATGWSGFSTPVVTPAASGPLTPSVAAIDSTLVVNSTTIAVTAVEPTQSTGTVEYRFWNSVTKEYSTWQTSSTWSNTGLTSGTAYKYKVVMRDDNTTSSWSVLSASVTP